MCLHEDVVDSCKQCIQNPFLEFFLNAQDKFLNTQDNGQLTGTIICDLEILCQTTLTISRRDSVK